MPEKKEMTSAECLRRILLFEKPDFIPNYENVALGPRLEQQWHKEGLPQGFSIDEYFGFVEPIHWYGWVGRGKYEPIPGVEGQGVLYQDDETIIFRDCWGRETQWYKGEEMPEGAHRILKDGISDRTLWDSLKGHFNKNEPWRYPDSVDTSRKPLCFPAHCWWPTDYQGEATTYEELQKIAASGEQLLQMAGPSMLGELKEYMGFENLCVTLYTDRELIREIIRTRTELALHIIDTVMDKVTFPILHFWEDIAYKSGPFFSPAVFEELAVPAYREIVDVFKSKGGQIISLDSDGDINLLIPGWLKGGINHIWPMEVNANMDVVALRRRYGHSFSMRGGINKFILLQDKDAMRRELERIAPVMHDGGYMPMIDHSVPTGVSFENFCLYMELKKEILGIRTIPREPKKGSAIHETD
jgi:hypothetical protein